MKEFARFRLDVGDQSLWRDNQRIHLTPKAFAILQYLVEHAGRLVTHDELLQAHWPDTFVQPEVLKSQILDIRTALGDSARDASYIETVPRRGYRFIAPVREATVAPIQEPLKPAAGAGKLVGRARAMDTLRNSLQSASKGERQLVFVTGEQGMGKTTVVEAFLREVAAGGVQIGRGQCLEGYGVVPEPYYPVLEALGLLAKGLPDGSLARVLETHAPTWLVQFPAMLTREHRATLQRELLGATRERMIREICEAFEKLTEDRVVVLLFEDLHWTDPSTVDLLVAVGNRRASARLVVIGTYRPVDLVLAQHPLKQASQSLKVRRLCREIALEPLDESDIAEYLSSQPGDGTAATGSLPPGLAHWIHKQTEGNPLFIVTVLDHLKELGHVASQKNAWIVATPLDRIGSLVPDTLRQVIELQVDRLSAAEQAALNAASVQGNVFWSAVTASALESRAAPVEEIYQKLALQNHIIRAASAEQAADGTLVQRYEFVHAAFRNVLYHRLTPARRATLHGCIGEALESSRSGDLAGTAAELAVHFEQAGDWPRTLKYLFLAASNSWCRYANREAVAILQHGLDLLPRLPEPERLRTEMQFLGPLLVSQLALHDTAGANATMARMAARAAQPGVEDVEHYAILLMVGFADTADSPGHLVLLDRMQQSISAQSDPLAQAKATAHYTFMRLAVRGWDAELAAKNAAAGERVRESGNRLAAASVLMENCYLHTSLSQYAQSLKNARECLPLLLEAGHFVRFLHGRELLAVNLTLLGQWGEALDSLDESIDQASRNEGLSRMAMPLVFKAWVHLEAMDFAGVARMCAEAMPLLDAPLLLDRRYIALRLAASAEFGLGRVDSALDRLLELRTSVGKRPVMMSWYWAVPLQLQVTEAILAQGDLKKARAEANRSVELAQAMEDRTWQALALEASARVALLEADGRRAEHDVESALRRMEGFDVPLAAWRVHGTAAKLYRRNGNSEMERHYFELSRNTVRSLAKSLGTRPALQQIFLSSTPISELLSRS